MKKAWKNVLAIATLVPHAILITFIWLKILNQAIPLYLLILILIYYPSLFVIYVLLILKSTHLRKSDKILWISAVFLPGLGVYISMPAFWILHVWREKTITR
jgi:uncharacterized membrane protein